MNSTRYPLIIAIPKVFDNLLPDSISRTGTFKKQIDGTILAFIESGLLWSFERMKVIRMTQEKETQTGYSQYFQQHRNALFKELFRGFNSLFLKSWLAWSVFLQSDNIIK